MDTPAASDYAAIARRLAQIEAERAPATPAAPVCATCGDTGQIVCMWVGLTMECPDCSPAPPGYAVGTVFGAPPDIGVVVW